MKPLNFKNMQIQIEINDNLIATLNSLADENTLAAEEYAANIVASFLEEQYRGKLLDDIKRQSIDELAIAKDAMDAAIISNKINPINLQ